MRVAIINLTGGGMSGGYRKYLCNVLPQMAKHDAVEAILCATPESIGIQAWFDPLPNVEFICCRPFHILKHNFDSKLFKHLERFSPDVIFVPVERSFRFGEIPVVNMLQNMEPFVNNVDGKPIGESFRQWVQYVDGRRAIKKANRVIALSRFVSGFFNLRWKIPTDKIGLVYHGIDVVRSDKSEKPPIVPENWGSQFIFTAGSIRHARGLEDLLLALKHLVLQNKDAIRLVIAGEVVPRMSRYLEELKKWIESHNLSSKVCWAGSLNEKEMAWCYQNCKAFIMTSRVESFGMIGGEALSYGCVCISVDNPCLPELFGNAALYYPPKDGKILAEKIQSVYLLNDNQRKTMSEEAKERAKYFSWDDCVEKTVAELSKASKNE